MNQRIDAEEAKMPYREKTAWLALIAMAVTFGPYFTIVSLNPSDGIGVSNLSLLGRYAATALAQVVILGIGHLILRLKSPDEARTPPDERDLAIARRSITCAYGVLLAGMILVGVIMPFTGGGWKIVNSAIFMIVVAEFVHYAVVAWSYRRQA